MFKHMPPIMQKASLALLIGLVVLTISLGVSGPIAFIVTLGLGCFGLVIGLALYLVYFLKEIKS